MRPSRLAILAVVILVASGVWAFWPVPAPPAPEGAIASDQVTIAVGEDGLGPVGAQIGLAVGAVLLLASGGWALWQRRGQGAETR